MAIKRECGTEYDGVRSDQKICNVLKHREATTNLGQHTGVYREDVRAVEAGTFDSTSRCPCESYSPLHTPLARAPSRLC